MNTKLVVRVLGAAGSIAALVAVLSSGTKWG